MSQLPVGISGRSALEVALEAAHTAGKTLRERFQGQVEITFKGRGNIVTDVDRQAEGEILALLGKEFPGSGFLAEESPEVPSESGYVWVVDPLDGTRNFASRVPYFATSIALAHRGEVLLGLTYDPVRDELFLAQRGAGATLNGRPIRVSQRAQVWQCLLGFDMGYSDERALQALKLVEALWPRMQSIRVMGSAALGFASAACGRIDIYFHHHLAPWDLAAGLLLVREAGGVITDRHAAPASLGSDSAIASSPVLLAQFLAATEGLEWREAP